MPDKPLNASENAPESRGSAPWSPTPWTVQNGVEELARIEHGESVDVPYWWVWDANGHTISTDFYDEGVSNQQKQANAQLQAAAPDLYEALSALRASVRPHPHEEGEYLILTADLQRVLPMCDAALLKARPND